MSLGIFTILWVLCKNIVVHTMKGPDNFYQYCKPSQITQYDSRCCRVAAIRLQAGRSVERASERPADRTDRPTQRPTDSPTVWPTDPPTHRLTDRPAHYLFFLLSGVGAPTSNYAAKIHAGAGGPTVSADRQTDAPALTPWWQWSCWARRSHPSARCWCTLSHVCNTFLNIFFY